jgi:PAS domain S-box-containing protein
MVSIIYGLARIPIEIRISSPSDFRNSSDKSFNRNRLILGVCDLRYLRAASQRVETGAAKSAPGDLFEAEYQMQDKVNSPKCDVLLVEDNQGDVFLVKEAIRVHAVPVILHVVNDGACAIEFIERAEQDPQAPSPKAMLLDLNLPKRTGVEVLRRLRQSPKFGDIPVIIATSSDLPSDREQVEKLGVSFYFRKPTQLGEFLRLGEILRRALERIEPLCIDSSYTRGSEPNVFPNRRSAAFRSSPAAMVILDVENDDCIVDINGRFEEATGYSRSDLIGRKAHELDIWTEPEEYKIARTRLLAEGRLRDFEFHFRKRNGETGIGLVSIEPIDLNGRQYAVTSSIDITDRKRAEAALHESEQRFRKVFEEGPLGLALVGRDYRFLKVNRALCEMVGYSEPALLQMSFADITYSDDLQADMTLAERLFSGELPFYRMQKRYVRENGDIIWIKLTASLIHHHEDESPYGLAMIEDVTEIKRAHEEALARQKLESVGLLAGGIAHDFNNLLGGVLAEAELAETKLNEGESPLESIRKIRSVASRGAEIVRQLMIYSGQDSAEPVEPINLSGLVQEMLELLRTSITKQAVLTVDLPADLPAVMGKASQLRQIVMNLVINASEAIGEKAGTISITTSRATPPRNSVAVRPTQWASGEYLKFEVSDTGIGMSEEVQARIFDPFFSTKFSGRGLGLAIVQRIVRDYEGAINVVSAPARGTRLEVLLPTVSDAVHPSHPSAARVTQKAHRTPSGTVLIVEDEEALRRAITTLLRKNGLEVIEAGDGTSALDMIRRCKDIDVMLLDMTLPGASSREVLHEAQRSGSNVKVILTSAYSKETVDSFFEGARIERFIRKPFQFHELMGLLDDALSA